MTFQDLIDLSVRNGGLATDDVLAALLPLFRQVAACHESGCVAPLRGIDRLEVDEQYRASFDDSLAVPAVRDDHKVDAVRGTTSRAFEITGRAETTSDVLAGSSEKHSLEVLREGDEVTQPVLVAGWEVWEHRLGHHDELADIASLGMLLVALAAGLDLANPDDLDTLARNRRNVFAIAPSLNPVVAGVATRMIEPDRAKRSQDLHSIVERLETYRDQPADFDIRQVAADRGGADLRRAVLTTLRDRLFDLSRRNRLIWFRSSGQSLNLTEASVPLLLDARNIRPEQIFTWNKKVAGDVLSGRPISLGSVVRWEDAPYAGGILDTLISQARRDRQEYGQAQLRLVVAFLRWHDLKGERGERISSPLLLLPVELSKKRGVRDSYLLQAETPEAEVNPALRQYLKQLYNLDLPPTLDLARESIADFHARLQADIHRSEPAVELRLQERPRMELIHSKALIRLQAFQRRAGRGNVTVGRRAYAYSYRGRDYRPLGLQIFLDRVVNRPAPILNLLGNAPAPRMPAMTSAVTVQKDLYVLDAGTGNPYSWDLDLCSLTLANFNYRTMSLVRDYRELLDNGHTSASFERLFSLDPRPLTGAGSSELPVDDRYLVLPSDASQLAAIAHARSGESLVIQGPPGTGKSQTITNLIADYVARGKRVLFVCQKRAAIDVVHARLRQRGLDELACLIHDSQGDKKAFVQGLRGTYEAWLADGDGIVAAEAQRARILARISSAISEAESFESSLAEVLGPGGPSLRWVVSRLIDLRDQRWGDDLPPIQRRLIPSPARWWAARPAIDQIAAALTAGGGDPRLALSPIRFLGGPVLDTTRPESEAAVAAQRTSGDLEAVVSALDEVATRPDGPVCPVGTLSLDTAVQVGRLGTFVLPLARRGCATVLNRSSMAAEALRGEVVGWQAMDAQLAAARGAASGWRTPLLPDDARAALAIAEAKEGSFLRFLDGGWRGVKRAVGERFSTGPRAVPVSVTQALRLLVAVHDREAALAAASESAYARWGYRDLPALATTIEELRRQDNPGVVAWRDRLTHADGEEVASVLADALVDLGRVHQTLDAFYQDVEDIPISELIGDLDLLADPRLAAAIRSAAPALRSLAEHPEPARAVRRFAATPDELEFAVCSAALDDAIATKPAVSRFDGARLADLVARIQALLPILYEADAAVIVGRVKTRFLAEVAHATRTVTGMLPADRERKKTWTIGRRELENEFRKVMRYRSIRDLASGETGAVVAALRPIWLMSPTSVSDTLPLGAALFDVVIYDEASQIPVEEAVPAMHRAGQVVVVGDRMQLPPTRFFTARAELADDPEDEVEVGVVLDGDSFLAQSAGRLASTMLTWHYRSRYESLIGFSNAAFYEGKLATIPDRRPAALPFPEISIDGSDTSAIGEPEGKSGVEALLARPISFHRMHDSVYRHRTNASEAAYIAQLVRELLRRGTGLTLGIVAFSEAQQSEIEQALETLAHADPEFAALYEEELVREDDDQVVGLFVKNLENVQGDERDVILMSVCYGPDGDGRMVMNFGPINQEGGEKRLNVIFSRARVHMAIVSSIDSEAITNTYNDGANTLRRFLRYAASVSRGDVAGADAVTMGFGDRRVRDSAGRPGLSSSTVAQLGDALRARGLIVAERVGQSSFVVDLAVRRTEDSEYLVAVLVDSDDRLRAQPLRERLMSHPGVLEATGWRVVHVIGKDWHQDAAAVVERIEKALEDGGSKEFVAAQVREELVRAAAEALVAPAPAIAATPSAVPLATSSDAGFPRWPGVQVNPTAELLKGKSVCFTGGSVSSIRGVRLTREDQQRLATQAGLDVRQSVSARLDILVVADVNSTSSKSQRAAELGVRKIAEPAFWRMLGVEVDGAASDRTYLP